MDALGEEMFGKSLIRQIRNQSAVTEHDNAVSNVQDLTHTVHDG